MRGMCGVPRHGVVERSPTSVCDSDVGCGVGWGVGRGIERERERRRAARRRRSIQESVWDLVPTHGIQRHTVPGYGTDIGTTVSTSDQDPLSTPATLRMTRSSQSINYLYDDPSHCHFHAFFSYGFSLICLSQQQCVQTHTTVKQQHHANNQ